MSPPPITTVLFDFAWTTFAPTVEDWVIPAAEDVGSSVTADQAQKIIADFDEKLRLTAVDPDYVRRDLDPALHRPAILTILGAIDGVSPALAVSLYEVMVGPRGWAPYPDTRPALEALRDLGVRIGLVSNIGWDVRKNFAHRGLSELVDAYVLSYEIGHVKPEPEIWAAALRALDAEPATTLMVGDHPAGDGGAVASGLTALVLPLVDSPASERGLARVLSLVSG